MPLLSLQSRLRAPSIGARRGSASLLVVVGAIALFPIATLAIALVEAPPLSIPDASPIYLVAVVGVAVALGTPAAIAAASLAFLLYDWLFVAPRFTLIVEDPAEYLNLLLLLFVGIVIGRLVALQSDRAEDAARRARESQALFRISRTLATSPHVAGALPAIVDGLRAETRMNRIWIGRLMGGREVIVADSGSGPHPSPPIHVLLTRTPGDTPARWVRTHLPQDRRIERTAPTNADLFRTKIAADDEALGSIWATRPRAEGLPDREETRLLSLAADQVGLAFKRERLAESANAAEVARQSEALKDALLDSVSHDLRTPLATIRAAAGGLMDPEVAWSDEERRAAARTIDLEADRLNGLVRNLLDMSRIEGGALRPSFEVLDLEDLVQPVVGRLAKTLDGHEIELRFEPGLPPVRADAVHFDEVLTNLLENAAKYAPLAPIRVDASACPDGRVRLRVEDGGPGIPPESEGRLFEKFYRVPRTGEGSRRGLGIGLGVVRGLAEAMGGEASVGRSDLGGLAVDVFLRAAPEPPAEPET
jgi:two-component system, OmpR family, sensor histidine kinase KdpD